MEQTINLVATTAKKRGITIRFDFDPDETILQADPSQLKQVFLNIIMNGIQSMADGGLFHITTALRRYEGFPGKESRSFVIVFRDRGEGIPAEHLDHIFDPFFTTKKDGTGLGLSISYGIIQQHGGDIEIESKTKRESKDDHGTTVTVQLPIM